MKRPKIENFFPAGTTLSEAMIEFKKSSSLFNYIKSLDDYVDYLESERINERIRLGIPEFNKKYFDTDIYEMCPNCFKKRSKGLICNFEICPIRLGEVPDIGHRTSNIEHSNDH